MLAFSHLTFNESAIDFNRGPRALPQQPGRGPGPDHGPRCQRRPQLTREVLNYVAAAERGLALLPRRPISVNLLNELHAILVHGTRGDSHLRGRVRDQQNWIGPSSSVVTEAHFVPPPPGPPLLEGLTEWERYIHDEEVPILVRCAVGHYQFETLHPYNDGNGRLGRLLVVLQLIEAGVLAGHLLSISPVIEQRRDEYVDGLQAVRQSGDLNPWIGFVCEVLGVAAQRSLERIHALLAWRDGVVSRVRSSGRRGLSVQVAQDLVGYPFVTAPAVAHRYGRTYQAAKNAIANLIDLGVLREVPDTSQPRAYAAVDAVRLMSS